MGWVATVALVLLVVLLAAAASTPAEAKKKRVPFKVSESLRKADEAREKARFAAKPVRALNPKAFKTLIGLDGTMRSNNYLVKFFTPWCGHCKKMQPDYDHLARAIGARSDFAEDSQTHLIVTEVNCEEFREVCSAAEIKGYPTVRLYKADGSQVDYKKQRRMVQMLDFVESEVL